MYRFSVLATVALALAVVPSVGAQAVPDDVYARTWGDFAPFRARGTGNGSIRLPNGVRSFVITVAPRSSNPQGDFQFYSPTGRGYSWGPLDTQMHVDRRKGGRLVEGLKQPWPSQTVKVSAHPRARWDVTIAPIGRLPALTLPITSKTQGYFRYLGPSVQITASLPASASYSPFRVIQMWGPNNYSTPIFTEVSREHPVVASSALYEYAGSVVAVGFQNGVAIPWTVSTP